MRIHFIAIGGAVMHNLAIALHKKGYMVTGSDDEIFDPSRKRLRKYGLLPDRMGWHPDSISPDIDIVILGMHAKDDNPELIKARDMGLRIKSFPEFLFDQTRNKKRVVVGGSHGKTTITSMIMHVLKSCDIKFDYMVGSIIEGFETMVGLYKDSEIAIFEGDEYLTSTLDRRPKFHLYNPDIAVISGIAWDHINVFPEYNNYVDQFRIFIDKITPAGTLIYNEDDQEVKSLVKNARDDIQTIPYGVQKHTIKTDGFVITHNDKEYPLKIFGEHNMHNISAAKEVCSSLGISDNLFFDSISNFQGSARRLEIIKESEDSVVYVDFAHAPSKVKATVSAISQRYPDHKKVCCFELHTYSSLSLEFLNHYNNCLSEADIGLVYFNPHAINLKRLKQLKREDVINSFGKGITDVFDSSEELFSTVTKIKSDRVVYLFMSSGDFNGTDLNIVAANLIADK